MGIGGNQIGLDSLIMRRQSSTYDGLTLSYSFPVAKVDYFIHKYDWQSIDFPLSG